MDETRCVRSDTVQPGTYGGMSSWAIGLPEVDPAEIGQQVKVDATVRSLRPWAARVSAALPEAMAAWWPFVSHGDVILRLRLKDRRGGERDLDVRYFPFRIGRGESCHLQLPGPTVSSEHAEIQMDRGLACLMDLKSTNGTRRNGQKLEPLTPVPLHGGDRIEIPPYTLTLIEQTHASTEPEAIRVRASGLQPARFKSPLRELANPSDRWARVQCGAHTVWVRVPSVWMRACWQHITEIKPDEPWETSAMEEGIAQFVLLQIANLLSDKLQQPVQIAGWIAPGEAPEELRHAAYLLASVWLSRQATELATTILCPVIEPQAAADLDLDDLIWPASVWAGLIRLKVSDWARIEVGDVLLPDVWLPAAWRPGDVQDGVLGSAYLRLARFWHTGGLRREQGSLKLSLEKLWVHTPGGDWVMAEKDAPTGELESVPVQDLELQIAIELDRVPVTLGDLKKWQVGQVLTLQRGADDLVKLVAETGLQRRVLAEGRVVLVHEKLGVEILRILTQFKESAST
ncbi:MAG: FHA domain-containing protein [Acidobacteriota bacterium]